MKTIEKTVQIGAHELRSLRSQLSAAKKKAAFVDSASRDADFHRERAEELELMVGKRDKRIIELEEHLADATQSKERLRNELTVMHIDLEREKGTVDAMSKMAKKMY